MNIHWDGGWMQPTTAKKDYMNNRLGIMRKQIARRFRNYGDHLLFAGNSEVMVDGDYGTPSPEYYNAQNSFNQTFITTVRATDGRSIAIPVKNSIPISSAPSPQIINLRAKSQVDSAVYGSLACQSKWDIVRKAIACSIEKKQV